MVSGVFCSKILGLFRNLDGSEEEKIAALGDCRLRGSLRTRGDGGRIKLGEGDGLRLSSLDMTKNNEFKRNCGGCVFSRFAERLMSV
jgi:hypothetical protein